MATDVESRRVDVAGKHDGSGLVQWALLLGPILAAYLQEQLSYAMVSWACTRGLRFLVHLPTLLGLAIIAVCAVLSWRRLVAAGFREPHDERSSDARARFMATASLTMAAFATLLVVAQWLPTIFIHPCTQ
jgi:MFS family permease